MGDVARQSLINEDWFYKEFGIDGEILIDHAWGIEPVRMKDIKGYHTGRHSLSNGQVLPRPYKYAEARIVIAEMIDVFCHDMYRINLVSRVFSWWLSFDWKSMETCPEYDGPVAIDFYGRLHPKHSNGTVRFHSQFIPLGANRAQQGSKTGHQPEQISAWIIQPTSVHIYVR